LAAPYSYTPLGFVQLNISGATGLGTIPAGASMALIVCETANVRWRDDGIAPTSSVGMLFSSGQEFQYSGNLLNIQFIAVSGSPVLDVSFYK
jgi:hypothetical protein